jgi:hypothetical protein
MANILMQLEMIELWGMLMFILGELRGNDSEQIMYGFILSSLSRTEETHVKP